MKPWEGGCAVVIMWKPGDEVGYGGFKIFFINCDVVNSLVFAHMTVLLNFDSNSVKKGNFLLFLEECLLYTYSSLGRLNPNIFYNSFQTDERRPLVDDG